MSGSLRRLNDNNACEIRSTAVPGRLWLVLAPYSAIFLVAPTPKQQRKQKHHIIVTLPVNSSRVVGKAENHEVFLSLSLALCDLQRKSEVGLVL